MNERAPRRRRRWASRAAAIAALGGAGPLCLASCGGSDAGALGHRACVEVATSLRLFTAAQRATPSVAARDRTSALSDLRDALQPAALAAGTDGQWQALEATLSESSRVPESDLVTALSAQCAATLQVG